MTGGPGLFDRCAERHKDTTLLGACLLVAVLFLPSGYDKLTHYDGFVLSLAQSGVPFPSIVAGPAVAVEFLGALCVLLGFQMRLVALVMFVFTGVTALVNHRFWQADAASYLDQYYNFMKNIGIMGGFLAFFAAGAGRWSLDGMRR
jgi:putative oxidoreductase